MVLVTFIWGHIKSESGGRGEAEEGGGEYELMKSRENARSYVDQFFPDTYVLSVGYITVKFFSNLQELIRHETWLVISFEFIFGMCKIYKCVGRSVGCEIFRFIWQVCRHQILNLQQFNSNVTTRQVSFSFSSVSFTILSQTKWH